MKNKIVLATVNAKKELYANTANELSAVPVNVQMGLIFSYIKSKGIEVDMIESDVDGILMEELIEIIEEKQPLLCGLICTGANPSSSTMTMAGIVEFFQKIALKKSNIKYFIWGPHPTVLPERTLRETEADFVIRGEGYETIVNLFSALGGNKKIEDISGLSYLEKGYYRQTQDADLVGNLDTLPMVNWEVMNPSRYRAHNWHCFGDMDNRTPYAIIWTSFGCPFKCNFCCINNLYGKRVQRFRSIDSVINEISILVEKYNVKHIKILDELFVVNPKRIKEFCTKLKAKNYDLNIWSYARVDTINQELLKMLKEVGMNWISYGFESANPQILAETNKNCVRNVDEVIKMTQREGVHICADVMVGLWNDSFDTMKQTYEFLTKYNFEWANIYPVFAYPGTDLYEKDSELKSWKTYALYGYECVPAGTKYLKPHEVLEFRDQAFIKYHSRPEYLAMIEQKFGCKTKEHLERMTQIPLKRRLLEEKQCF
ncbi:MAG: radical SAM protein [Candidatus Saelkia tenebricola]|nr:radical SAM protein [Candidatus Saelkia tenebricola]